MNETYRVPWPVIRLPFGHIAEHPLRLQLSEGSDKGIWDFRIADLEQGTILSHLSFNLCKIVSKSKVPMHALTVCIQHTKEHLLK
jgi:hypothetical protein